MLVAGGNGSFVQITAPLRVTLSQAGLRITGSDMCDCVYRRILRYITLPCFSCTHMDTTKAGGFLGGKI